MKVKNKKELEKARNEQVKAENEANKRLKAEAQRKQWEYEAKLNKDEYQIIGENSLTKELILQLKHFSPSELDQAKQFIQSLPMVQNARIPDWAPTR